MARTANRKPTTTNSIKETSFVALEASADESRIDETNHVIRGVKVIGRTSAHGYEYSPKAVTEAKGAYEGARVYVGHKRETATRTGSYGERLGVLKNYRVQEGEGFANLHYNPKHPQADQFVFDVKNTPNLHGFSHHADIVVRKNSTGKTVVESIDKVYSVDLVNVPATTKGVFESEGDTMQTLKQMIEAVSFQPDPNTRTRLPARDAPGDGAARRCFSRAPCPFTLAQIPLQPRRRGECIDSGSRPSDSRAIASQRPPCVF